MRKLFLAATALLCARYPAYGQSAAEPLRQALTISAGVAQENRRDDADSPLAYGGSGPDGRVDYDWTRGARHWHLALFASASTLTPTASVQEETQSQETFNSYVIEAGTDWRLRGSSARIGTFAIGVEFAATVTTARHLYEGQDLSQQTFDLGTLTLGPTARWTRRVRGGELSASLAVPLIAWVDHPYADVRFATQFSSLRYSPPSQYHQANGAITYAFRPESRFGATAAYRLGVFDLQDIEPVRRVSQSLSIAFVTRFGMRR